MTKLTETLNRLDAIHQLPEDHPISQRERISLAHIDVAADLRRSRERFEKKQAQGRAAGTAAAAAFAVGQTVRTKLNDRGAAAPLFGIVTVIDGNKITLDSGRQFVATALVAA